MSDSDEADATLQHSEGDDCPRDDCGLTIKVNEYDFEPKLGEPEDTDPEGPLAEAFCPVHGIHDSI